MRRRPVRWDMVAEQYVAGCTNTQANAIRWMLR